MDCIHPHNASQCAENAAARSMGKHKQQSRPVLHRTPEHKFCHLQGRRFRDSAFSNLLPQWGRAWNSNLVFCHLLLLPSSVRTSQHRSFLCLRFILHHDLHQYLQIKDDAIDCSYHAASRVWQAKGTDTLWWEQKGRVQASKGPEEVTENKMTLYICMQSGNVDSPVYAGSTRISLRCNDMKAMCIKSKSDSEF